MPKEDLHAWAAAAVRELLRRCVLILAAQLEREARESSALARVLRGKA